MKKVYLAGPEVFQERAKAIGEQLKALCKNYGFEGLFPLDNQIRGNGTGRQVASEIYYANIAQILQADFVIANMTPFRGPSMDVGTAFEIGFAAALGKPVFGYTDDPSPYDARVEIADSREGKYYDKDGLVIESFGLIDNLMMVEALHSYGPVARNAEDALIAAQNYFRQLESRNLFVVEKGADVEIIGGGKL